MSANMLSFNCEEGLESTEILKKFDALDMEVKELLAVGKYKEAIDKSALEAGLLTRYWVCRTREIEENSSKDWY